MGRGYSPEETRQKLIDALRDADGMSGTEISEKLGMSRLTMSKYLQMFAAEGLLRQKVIGSVTLWYLEPGQEAFVFPDDYFKVASAYMRHVSECDRDAAQSLIRNCIHSGASASKLVLEAVFPAAGSIAELYDSGKIGSAEQSLMEAALSGTLQMLFQTPVVPDEGKNVIVLADGPQSLMMAEAAAAMYHSEGWRVSYLGDMSRAVDVLFEIDFQKLAGRVWRQKSGMLAVAVFSATPEGMNFFADSVNSVRKKSSKMRLILCGRIPKNASLDCDLAAGSLEEVMQWSKAASEQA